MHERSQGMISMCPTCLEVLDQIRDMEVSVDQFESELDELGAPWTPGRLPSWEAN